MVMSSHEIGAMAMQQQAMFGNFANYSQQIMPFRGGVPGMGPGVPGGGMQGAMMPYQPPMMGGYITGPPPAPPPAPPPMPAWSPSPYGGMYSMARALTHAGPGVYASQAMGEQLLGTPLSALATGAGTLTSAGSMLTTGAGAASMLGIGGRTLGLLGGIGGTGLMGGLQLAQFGAENLYTGFQQRQAVNRVLRSRFGNEMGIGGGRGGMGFSTDEMGQISTMVRSMAGNDMFMGFDELVRVMDRTSQMGLYRGVNSAREFRERFRETVSTLREVAETMHTTLEDATSFMESQRRMGFFSGREISANLARTRMMAGATGMSVEQMQQIGMQGTQMGRAMGMRGRVGARAMQGMATNFAMAMQTGTLSEEMVAEATGGLQGAEAAQAMAARMMQIGGRFLSRPEGRAVTAALWDPRTGGVNRELLERVQSGQVGFRELTNIARQNIREGDRGEFFAQEERLRGQVMEAAGGDIAGIMLQ